ncbi:MAG TPA: hypothetical protein ENJ08_11165 [Gammaproteobacteria bacterium]|nr:hypothetical protein [Gammaproteobacteria bacterium]
MSQNKLLKKLSELLDMDKKERKKRIEELQELINALKRKEKKLLSKCQVQEQGSKKKMLEREIAILHAKRKKGLKAIKKLLNG